MGVAEGGREEKKEKENGAGALGTARKAELFSQTVVAFHKIPHGILSKMLIGKTKGIEEKGRRFP